MAFRRFAGGAAPPAAASVHSFAAPSEAPVPGAATPITAALVAAAPVASAPVAAAPDAAAPDAAAPDAAAPDAAAPLAAAPVAAAPFAAASVDDALVASADPEAANTYLENNLYYACQFLIPTDQGRRTFFEQRRCKVGFQDFAF